MVLEYICVNEECSNKYKIIPISKTIQEIKEQLPEICKKCFCDMIQI